MNLAGVGPLEVLVILVIALVVVGPNRTMSMARSAGKMMGELRRAMGDISKALEDEDWETRGERGRGEAPRPQEEPKPEDRP